MKFDITLYLVTDGICRIGEDFYHTVEAACKGGVTLVQLREKSAGGREYLEKAIRVKKITDRFGIPLIIDDRADIALAADAAGVHVGAEDMPAAQARRILGPDKIVGVTAKTVEAARKAWQDGADYLGVGAIYPTTTKVKTVLTQVSVLKEICKAVPIPVVAIGGLNRDNLEVLRDSGIAGISVVSAVMKAEDPAAAAGELKQRVREVMGIN